MEKMDRLSIETEDRSSLLLGQSLALGLLGKLLYTYPEPSMLGTVLDEELYAEIPFAGAQADVISGLSSVRAWFRENMQRQTTRGCSSDRGGCSLHHGNPFTSVRNA
jgi:hypothetical protein